MRVRGACRDGADSRDLPGNRSGNPELAESAFLCVAGRMGSAWGRSRPGNAHRRLGRARIGVRARRGLSGLAAIGRRRISCCGRHRCDCLAQKRSWRQQLWATTDQLGAGTGAAGHVGLDVCCYGGSHSHAGLGGDRGDRYGGPWKGRSKRSPGWPIQQTVVGSRTDLTVARSTFRSIGLVANSSHPASRHFSRSPAMAWAVKATTGRR